jgi:hypothetical protein
MAIHMLIVPISKINMQEVESKGNCFSVLAGEYQPPAIQVVIFLYNSSYLNDLCARVSVKLQLYSSPKCSSM